MKTASRKFDNDGKFSRPGLNKGQKIAPDIQRKFSQCQWYRIAQVDSYIP